MLILIFIIFIIFILKKKFINKNNQKMYFLINYYFKKIYINVIFLHKLHSILSHNNYFILKIN